MLVVERPLTGELGILTGENEINRFRNNEAGKVVLAGMRRRSKREESRESGTRSAYLQLRQAVNRKKGRGRVGPKN